MPVDGPTVNEEKLWNADDVILAAELGKALFEHNKILYEALEKARIDNNEKQLELELMTQQLSELRDLIQKKAALLEEADSHILELDRINHRLIQESALAKKQIKKLTAYIVYLEQQQNNDQDDRAKTFPCEKPSNPRPWYAEPAEGPDRWTLRTGYSSPLSRGPSPSDCSLALRTNRPSTVKDDFIDDELSDQPQLDSCLILPLTTEPRLVCGACGNAEANESPSLFRCSSWPAMFSSDLIRHTSINRIAAVVDRNTPVPRALKAMTDRFASHDVIITCSNTVSENICPQNRATQAAQEPCDWSSVDSNADLKSLKDLLDDALFIKRLETIYHIKLRSQIPNDYQPSYKQLFQDAFQLIRSVRTPVSREAT